MSKNPETYPYLMVVQYEGREPRRVPRMSLHGERSDARETEGTEGE